MPLLLILEQAQYENTMEYCSQQVYVHLKVAYDHSILTFADCMVLPTYLG